MQHLVDHTIKTFEGNQGLLVKNIEDFTAADAARPAGPGGNNTHWLLGHIAYWRSAMTGMLGGEPLWPEDAHEAYRGILLGDAPESLPMPFEDTRDAATQALTRLVARLREVRDLDEPPEALGMVASLATHEAYHVGQLGVMRRVLGKKGVVGKKP